MATIHGIIFDLDGVITDTAEYHYLGWKRLADEEGIPFDRKKNEQLRGVSRRESLEILIGDRNYTEEQMKEMMERKNSYYVNYIQKITPKDLLPGAKETVLEFKRRGIKVAIASASKNTKTVLKNLEITDIFDAISDGYSVKKTKPAPDLFLFTADSLSEKPEHCVVVEDAESGVEAALSGNMFAVGIGPEERVGKAHLRYSTIGDMNVDEVLSL